VRGSGGRLIDKVRRGGEGAITDDDCLMTGEGEEEGEGDAEEREGNKE